MRAVTLAATTGERPTLRRHWDATLCNLLQAAWDAEPSVRPSFAAVLDQLNAFHLAEFKCTFEEALKNGKGGRAGGSATSGCCAVM